MPLSTADVAALSSSHDIIALGMRADEVRKHLHGTRATFVRVADVGAAPGDPILVPPGAGEVRIVGAPVSREAAIVRVGEVHERIGGLPLSGFSLAELEALARGEHTTLRALLEELGAAGLELVGEASFDELGDPRRSIEEVNIAGLTLARLTIERGAKTDVPAQLSRVAELQRQVAVIRAFAPLPRRLDPLAPTTGYEDVKRVALARLLVDNIPSIQVDWSLYGPKLAQVALTLGADDADAVSAADGLAEGWRRSPLEEIRRNIRAAGLEPVERNGRFDVVTE